MSQPNHASLGPALVLVCHQVLQHLIVSWSNEELAAERLPVGVNHVDIALVADPALAHGFVESLNVLSVDGPERSCVDRLACVQSSHSGDHFVHYSDCHPRRNAVRVDKHVWRYSRSRDSRQRVAIDDSGRNSLCRLVVVLSALPFRAARALLRVTKRKLVARAG